MNRHVPPSVLRDEVTSHIKRAVSPRKKRFGIEWSPSPRKGKTRRWQVWRWYASEKQRDQSLEDLERHTSNILKDTGHAGRYRKVDR